MRACVCVPSIHLRLEIGIKPSRVWRVCGGQSLSEVRTTYNNLKVKLCRFYYDPSREKWKKNRFSPRPLLLPPQTRREWWYYDNNLVIITDNSLNSYRCSNLLIRVSIILVCLAASITIIIDRRPIYSSDINIVFLVYLITRVQKNKKKCVGRRRKYNTPRLLHSLENGFRNGFRALQSHFRYCLAFSHTHFPLLVFP